MKPIIVITYWGFKDALIQSYTLPYVKIITKISGRKVYLVCLEQSNLYTLIQERVNINSELKKYNIEVVFFNYYRFGLKQIFVSALNLIKLLKLVVSHHIEYIHTWCTPAGAIGYLLSILSNRKLILDSYEPHAELMVETGTWQKSGLAYKILFKLEKLQTKRAVKIIGVVPQMKDYALAKYNYKITPSSFYVKPACVDFNIFYPRLKNSSLLDELNLKGKIVGVYAGKIGGIYLEDELFDFIKQCYLYWGERFVMLLLTGSDEQTINRHINRIDIPLEVVIKKFVNHSEIANYIALGDFALNFMKPVPARRLSAPIKDGEYWALGLPVIITAGIAEDSCLIENNNIGYVLKDFNNNEYQNAIQKLELLMSDQPALKDKIWNMAKRVRSFKIAEDIYNNIYGKSF